MNRITTTIKREFLRDIVAGRKKIEYRELKPYWTNQLKGTCRTRGGIVGSFDAGAGVWVQGLRAVIKHVGAHSAGTSPV